MQLEQLSIIEDFGQTSGMLAVAQVSRNELVYAFIEPVGNTVKLIKSYNFKNKEKPFDDFLDDLKKVRITRIIVGINDERFTLLPKELLNDELSHIALTYIHDIAQTDKVFKQALAWQDMYAVYAINNLLYQSISKLGYSIYFSNTYVCLLTTYANVLHKHNGNILCAHIEENFVTLTGYTNSKLMVHQTYSYSTIEDIHYIMERAIQKTGLGVVPILFNGSVPETMRTYFAAYYNLVNCELPAGINYPKALDNGQAAYCFTLFSIAKYAHN